MISGIVIFFGLIGQRLQEESITYNNTNYYKAPSLRALNDATELNQIFLENCLIANGVYILGGTGLSLAEHEYESAPLKMEVSVDQMKTLVHQGIDIWASSYDFYNWILQDHASLLENVNPSHAFTVLLFNNHYELLCICQVRQYNVEEKLLFKVNLHCAEKKIRQYNFYVEKTDLFNSNMCGVIRTFYFLCNANGKTVLAKEGTLTFSLPDPGMPTNMDSNGMCVESRFNYFLNAKK